MAEAALKIIEGLPRAAHDDYLGPAEVVDVAGASVVVTLPSGARATAEMALAYPYVPAPGDVLLVIGKGNATYVIGVLRGAGTAALAFQGDVAVRAIGGALRLEGDAGVELTGPVVRVQAGRLETVADAAVQTFTTLCQRVTSLLRSHAGQSQTLVDDVAYSQAKSATSITEETMTMQGKTIHMF